ncbi:MAG: MATE family efflux transporter [Elainellaceae cyanobacterium]
MSLRSRFWAELRSCLYLAIPLASAQLAQAATGFVDTLMMGILGSQYLAAGGLGSTTFTFLLLISTAILSAVSPLVAEAHGQDDSRTVTQMTVQGLWLAGAITLPLSILIWNAAPLLRSLGQEESTVLLATDYLQAVVWGLFPVLVFTVLKNFVSALSKPRSVMVIMVAGVVLNAIANYTLIFGKFGFPALGLSGVGWASAFSYWVIGIALSLYVLLRSPFNHYPIWRSLFQVRLPLLRMILSVGLPIGLLATFETGLFSATTLLAGRIDASTLAAHHIALQTAAVTFMVPFGISQATTVRVGQLIGQRNPANAKLAGYAGIAAGTAFMGLMAIAMISLPRQIVGLYLNLNDPQNQEVIGVAIALLSVGAVFQLFDGIQVIAAGALRGLKDTRMPMLIGIIAYWGIGFTAGYLSGFRLGLGGVGLWLGLALGLFVAAIALTWRFYRLTTPLAKMASSGIRPS